MGEGQLIKSSTSPARAPNCVGGEGGQIAASSDAQMFSTKQRPACPTLGGGFAAKEGQCVSPVRAKGNDPSALTN